ncbi:hypothetical protein BBP40_004644 [Aspergillus hancockii]|nr:hypothetical protein BBP40_004644 [Aspergillus hancockii]
MPETGPSSPSQAIIDSSNPVSSECQVSCSSTHSSVASTTTLEADERSKRFHSCFLLTLNHLRTRLYPLVSSTTALPHPEFPPTLLAYHLLTSRQLDTLAIHYHQVWPPVPATDSYPVVIPPWIGTENEKDLDLETKRRRFGRFIGLQRCESPVEEVTSYSWET